MQVKRHCKGSSTIEVAIIMPVIFALIFASIVVFLILYQKALIQSLAENMAESIARQWNYTVVSYEEIENGAYTKDTYDEREIYWELKTLTGGKKRLTQLYEDYIRDKVSHLGPLKPDRTGVSHDDHIDVSVSCKYGLVTTVDVNIAARYKVPGAGILKLVGLDDLLLIKGEARTHVFGSKDMINTTDYVIQLVRGTRAYDAFIGKIKPIKDALNKIIGR